MEDGVEFSSFCNICYNTEDIRKVEKSENLLKILMIIIGNKTMLNDQDIYLCSNCCEKLESYDQFKEMCLRNFIDFRIQYLQLKKKLEISNDPYVIKKLRNFIVTKVYGVSDTMKPDGSEDTVNTEYDVVPMQEIETNFTEKEDEGNNYNYNFHNVRCKTEKIDFEENDEYKFHNDHYLRNSGNDFELPVPVEHIKVESFVEEDIGAAESTSKNKFIEPSQSTESYKIDKSVHTSTDLTQHKEHVFAGTVNKNPQTSNQKTREIECNFCRKTFVNVPNLKNHMLIHTGDSPFTCTICNTSFTKSRTFRAHQLIHAEKKRYSCSVCYKTYTKISNLKAHEGVHTGQMPHICHICNKAFGLPDRLKEHMLIHSDEKPYSCLTCNKNFRRLRELKGHERVHTGEKPFACSMCDKTFSNSGNLKTHELVHTGEKPYTCEVCQKSFRHINHLKVHKRIHSGEKPYECTECNERFTHLNSYKVHKLTHTGERPHSCNVCKRTFRELNTLREHERLHTGNKPYSCEICKKTFNRKIQLRMHKQRPCIFRLLEAKK